MDQEEAWEGGKVSRRGRLVVWVLRRSTGEGSQLEIWKE